MPRRAPCKPTWRLKRGKVDDAIIHLERAVDDLAEDRRSRVRWAFILYQLYQVKGFEEKAIAQFGKVVRMNPPTRWPSTHRSSAGVGLQ